MSKIVDSPAHALEVLYKFGKITSMSNRKSEVTLYLNVWGIKTENLESNGDVSQSITKITRTYTHSKLMTDKVI